MTPTCIWMYLAGVATGIALVCIVMAAWRLWEEDVTPPTSGGSGSGVAPTADGQ